MRSKRTGKLVVNLFLLSIILILVTACGGKKETVTQDVNKDNNKEEKTAVKEESQNISIGTMPVGGSINTVGNGIASIISKNSSIRLSVKPYDGISAWGPSLNKGELAMGVATIPELTWAHQGVQGFESIENMRLLIRGNYIPVTGIVVREDSGINKVSDLKGKKFTSEYPGSVSAKMLMEAVLAANGLDWDDVDGVPTPTLVAGMEALRDKRVDGTYAMAPGTPALEEVHNTTPLKALSFIDDMTPDEIDSIPQNIVDEVTSRVPGIRMTVVKPGGYILEETVGAEYPLGIVSSSHLSDDAVYEIMETLWENYEDLKPIHAWFQSWTPEQMFDPNPTIPYHPGAVQFFKDQGLWNDEVDKIQQELSN